MITKIDTNLPTSTNKKIINTLFTTSLWTHAWDKNSHHNINNPDSGMALMSFQNNETQHTPHPASQRRRTSHKFRHQDHLH